MVRKSLVMRVDKPSRRRDKLKRMWMDGGGINAYEQV